MEYKLQVVADTNDGDLRTNNFVIDETQIDEIKRLFGYLEESLISYYWDVEDNDFQPMRAEYGDLMSEEDFNYLCELIPSCEMGYSRSVESVTLTPLTDIITIL